MLFLLALACAVLAGLMFSHTDLPAHVILTALLAGLGLPYLVITAVHNHHARRSARTTSTPD